MMARSSVFASALLLVAAMAGAAAVSTAAENPFDTEPDWILQVDRADSWLGSWVAPAGDVNGDGLADVIAGAPIYENGEPREGAIFVFLGREDPGRLVPDWTLEGGRPDALLSRAATAGDVNGDGFDDVAVSDPYYSAGLTDRGRVLVFLGSPSGLRPDPAWVFVGDSARRRFGYHARTAGDVNADGWSDLVVSGSRLVLLFLGSPAGLQTTPAWSVAGELPSDSGRGPAALDVNGDRFDDLLVARYVGTRQEILLYRGYPHGLRPRAHATLGPSPSGNFGVAYAQGGDVNGDGASELLVGTVGLLDVPPGSLCCPPDQVFLYEAGGRGFRDPGTLIHTTAFHRDLVPLGLDGAGDVDGDGFDDVMVTEYAVDPNVNGIPPIRVLVFAGSPDGVVGAPVVMLSGFQLLDGFGESAAAAGDFDGDGHADLIVGAPRHDDGETNEGVALIYRGGSFPPH